MSKHPAHLHTPLSYLFRTHIERCLELKHSMNPPAISPDNASRLVRLRQFGTRPDFDSFRGQFLAFDAAGQRLASMGRGASGMLQWWDLQGDHPQRLAVHPVRQGSTVGFLEGDECIVSLTQKGILRTWSVADGAPLQENNLNLYWPDLGLARQGEQVLVASRDGLVFLWDACQGRRIRELASHSTPMERCALSPDGRLAVAGPQAQMHQRGVLRFWETATGRELATVDLDASSVEAMTFEPSGRRLAVATHSNQILVIEAATRKVLRTFGAPICGTYDLSFSPDGSLLAVAWTGAGFSILSTEDGQKLYSHSDTNDMQASSARFSPDGRSLVWGQGDGTVGVWGVAPEQSKTP